MDSLTFKYKVIKNFLSEDEVNILKKYTQFYHRYNQKDYCEQTNNCDTGVYSDPLMESILDIKTNIMEKETGFKKLCPTYSFWRMYTLNGELTEHTDRPSCEVSVTVQIDSDGTKYPINIEGTDIHLENGDAVAYSGCFLKHSRKKFTGDFHTQVFLHYVDDNGPFSMVAKDARPTLGAPVWSQDLSKFIGLDEKLNELLKK